MVDEQEGAWTNSSIGLFLECRFWLNGLLDFWWTYWEKRKLVLAGYFVNEGVCNHTCWFCVSVHRVWVKIRECVRTLWERERKKIRVQYSILLIGYNITCSSFKIIKTKIQTLTFCLHTYTQAYSTPYVYLYIKKLFALSGNHVNSTTINYKCSSYNDVGW